MPTFITAQRPSLPRDTERCVDLAAHKLNGQATVPASDTRLAARACADRPSASPRKRAGATPSWALFGPKSLLKSLGKRSASAAKGTDQPGTAYPERRLPSAVVVGRPVAVASQAQLRASQLASAQALAEEQAAATPAPAVEQAAATPPPYRSLLQYPLNEVLTTEKSYNAGLTPAIKAYQDFLNEAQTSAETPEATPLPADDIALAQAMVRDLTKLQNFSNKLIGELEASIPVKTDEDRQRYCSAIAELTTSNDFVSSMWSVVNNYTRIKHPQSGLSTQLCNIEKAGGSEGRSIVAVQRLARYPLLLDEVAKQSQADIKHGLASGTDYAEVAADMRKTVANINSNIGKTSPQALSYVSYTRGSNAPVLPDAMAAIIAQNRKFAMHLG